MTPVRLTKHALQQCQERGATEEEVRRAIEDGTREPARQGRFICRYNFPYERSWGGEFYAVKQVAPVIKEEPDEIVVITVYTYFF